MISFIGEILSFGHKEKKQTQLEIEKTDRKQIADRKTAYIKLYRWSFIKAYIT